MDQLAAKWQTDYEHAIEAAEKLTEALEQINGEYEIDWADKARLRDFIRNQKNIAGRALAEYRTRFSKDKK